MRARHVRPRHARVLTSATFGLVVVLLCEQPSAVRASIFGEESAILSAILGENIVQVASMAETVANLYTQIRQLESIYDQGTTLLQTLKKPQDVLKLLQFAKSLLAQGGQIERNVRLLHYKLTAIEEDRKKVFPELADVPAEEFKSKARTWNAALQESSMVAMRAQTSVDSLQARLDYVHGLLDDSESAKGVVAQLQIANKMLGLLHADLAALEANLAYGQRVTATWGAVQSAEYDRATEEGQRMLDNYKSRGSAPRKLSSLP